MNVVIYNSSVSFVFMSFCFEVFYSGYFVYYKFIVMKKVSTRAWYSAKSDGNFHLHDATVLISVAPMYHSLITLYFISNRI